MTQAESQQLAKVQATLDYAVKLLEEVRTTSAEHGDRLTQLGAVTRDAIPQVWKNRDRIASLEASQRQSTGIWARVWDVVRLAIAAAFGVYFGKK